MSQSPVKPLTAEERAELRRWAGNAIASNGAHADTVKMGIRASWMLALLDALDEAEAEVDQLMKRIGDLT